VSRLPLVLVLSGALHAALVLGVVAALGGPAPSMLFVDFIHGFGAGSDGAGGERAPRASEPAAPRASAPARASASPKASASPTAHDRSGAPVAQPTLARASTPTPPAATPTPSVAPAEPESAPAMPFVPPPPVAEVAPSTMADATTSRAGEPAAAAPAATSSGDGLDAGTTRPGITASGAPGTPVGHGAGSGGGEGSGLGTRQGSALALTVPGDGGGEAAEYDSYYALVRSRVHEILKYPTVARRRGLTGRVEIDIDIAPTGAIGAVALVASSSHRLLDDAALEAVDALGRVPFPQGVRPRHLRMRLPVVFTLR